jgi:hypothetical protein
METAVNQQAKLVPNNGVQWAVRDKVLMIFKGFMRIVIPAKRIRGTVR